MVPSPPRTVASRPAFAWDNPQKRAGWLLLPLRAFLGITFTYAGLQKLWDPGYLDPKSPTSVVHQMQLLRATSPIGPLLELSAHAPTLVGLLIAFGELAVGVGTLLGLHARLAAAGGALLALSFFLTVSWNTTPYYYGSDIVYFFAWLVMLGFGAGGVLSLDARLRERTRRQLGLGPEPAAVALAVPKLRTLCARGPTCGLASDGHCTRLAGCPVFPVSEALAGADHRELDRRTAVAGGAAAAVVGVGVLAGGGVTAAIGRLLNAGSARPSRTASGAGSAPKAAKSPSAPSAPPAAGTAIAAAAAVPVGQAKSFVNPGDGNPAWVVHPSGNTFVAFSAVCTHAGCPVNYDPSSVQFVCPCHGGVYDARTGQVLQGPPPAPLASIPVRVVNGQIRT